MAEISRISDLFRLSVEAAPNAMIMINRDRLMTLANRKAEELFGYARLELLGQPLEMLVPDRFRADHPARVATFHGDPRARAMGAGRNLFARRKDGGEVPVEIGLNPIETPQGRLTLAVIIDISERRRMEVAHDRLAAIVEFSDDAIISKTLDGVITSWNRGAERLLGYTVDEIVGQSMLKFVPERLAEEEQQLLARIRDNERIDHFETVRRSRDNREIEVSVTLSPLYGPAGEVIGASSILRDITELKRRDVELRRSNAQLEQFAYVASHDLQEPLRMVANYTELLAQRYQGRLDERADKYIQYASDGARRMQRLVTDLLAYSRVGSQGKPLVPVACSPVMASVLHVLEAVLQDAEAVVECDDLPAVLADEGQLGQLFQNLLANAAKFRSERPLKVSVRADQDGAFWRFSFADNGIGMDMQYADRIFQMFQRLHGRGVYAGSGIGLAIAKQIVERHGGGIWVEAELGRGTTFFFTLQAAAKELT
jgi:PAS domain S-box-containing protein